MKTTNYIIRPKPCAGLKRNKYKINFPNAKGGGPGIVFMGLACLLLVFLVLINIADYSVYTFKRNSIARAMDYAITAAVQQLSYAINEEGLADGFSETTGTKSTENIQIDIDSARKVFLSMLQENVNPEDLNLEENLLMCTTYTQNNQLTYCIKTSRGVLSQGTVTSPSLMEEKINEAIALYWPGTQDNSRVFINMNSRTNMLQNGTYLFAFIKNIRISGIHTARNIHLSSLAGAKVERG